MKLRFFNKKETEMNIVKNPLLSKTLWTNLVMAVAAFIPGVHEWIAGNPIAFTVVFSVVNMALRAVTKDPLIQIS